MTPQHEAVYLLMKISSIDNSVSQTFARTSRNVHGYFKPGIDSFDSAKS